MPFSLTGLSRRLAVLRRIVPHSNAVQTTSRFSASMPIWTYAMAAVLAAAVLAQVVRLMWALLVPLSPLGVWQPKGAEILEFSQRKSLFSSFDPFFRSSVSGPATATVTTMGLTLHGVNVNEATGGGSAILSGEDGVQTSYAVGDEIAAGVTLATVAFDHVVLDRGGARESLFMDQSSGTEATVPPPANAVMSPAPAQTAPTNAVLPPPPITAPVPPKAEPNSPNIGASLSPRVANPFAPLIAKS